MADIQDTDQFLVNRSDSTATVTASDLMADLLDDDLMLVNRSDQTYKVTGADVKASLGGGGQPLPPLGGIAVVLPEAPFVGGLLTCVASGEGGKPPYNYEYQWFRNGSQLTDETSSTYLISAYDVGVVFKCEVTITDDNGSEFVIMSNETEPSQEIATAPAINTVTVTELDENAPRFTDASFLAEVDMANEGKPVSVKTFDAYVEGRITQKNQFIEPLESSGLGTQGIYSGKGIVTCPSGFQDGSPDTPFAPGGPDQYCSSASTTSGGDQDYGATNSIYMDMQKLADAGADCRGKELSVYMADPGLYMQARLWEPNNSTEITPKISLFNGYTSLGVIPANANLGRLQVFAQSGTLRSYMFHIAIDGVRIQDGGAGTATALTFAAGTDMSALAAGDTVKQAATSQPTYSGKGIVRSPSGFHEGSADTPFIGGTVDYCTTNSTTNGGTVGYGATNSIFMDLKKLANAGADVRGKELEVYMNSPAANMQAFVWATDKTTQIVGKTPLNNNGYHSLGVIPADADIGELQLFAQSITDRGYMFHIKIDGVIVKDNGDSFGDLTGTVGSIADTTVTLTDGTSGWVNGVDVVGPDKAIVIDNAKKYLKFDSNGNVSDLLDAPQNPPYDTSEENPSFTLTFPSTFPSGQAPDDEIGEGAILTVEVTATNLVGDDGPKKGTVQPTTTRATGIRDMTDEELAEQKLKFGTYNNRAAVYEGEQAMVQREALLKELQEKGLDASEVLKTKAKRGRRKKAD